MIYFNTRHYELFNYIIHRFLEIEVFDFEENINNMIDFLLPKYLRREQYKKCRQTFEELYRWTQDKYPHEMEAFHELVLYQFLEYMADLQEDDKDFNDIYFDDKWHSLIEKAAIEDYEDDDEISIDEHKEYYYMIRSYSDMIFEETDFLLIDMLYNERSFGSANIQNNLGIDIDFYFDLLPLDIQNQFKTSHITLTSEVTQMLRFIQDKITYGNLFKLFWNNQEPINENKVQMIFDNLMTAYYCNQEIEILWESNVNRNVIDFKIYKRRNENKKFLFQLRRAAISEFKAGFEEELMSYGDSYDNSYYIIMCFTDEEYNLTSKFIDEYIYTETFRVYLNITIFDVRKRNSPSN